MDHTSIFTVNKIHWIFKIA